MPSAPNVGAKVGLKLKQNYGKVRMTHHCGSCDSTALTNTGRCKLLAPPIEVWLCDSCHEEIWFPRAGAKYVAGRSGHMIKIDPELRYERSVYDED